jgi:DNA polymerase III delta prime subunit
MSASSDDEEFDLGISLESVAAIVDAARAVQEGEESGALEREEEDEEGLDADDDENMDEDALRAFIAELNEDEQASLIALAWIGRGDYSGGEFEEARSLAKERNVRDPAEYLLGIDMLGDMLEEGLSELGLSLEDTD